MIKVAKKTGRMKEAFQLIVYFPVIILLPHLVF